MAHRHTCVAHGVRMRDEYPKICHRQDWEAHDHNWHRLHTAVEGPPASRLPTNNVCVKDT